MRMECNGRYWNIYILKSYNIITKTLDYYSQPPTSPYNLFSFILFLLSDGFEFFKKIFRYDNWQGIHYKSSSFQSRNVICRRAGESAEEPR